MRDIDFDKIKVGMILQEKRTSRKFVVIDLSLNGDDDWYSRVDTIPESVYVTNKEKVIPLKDLHNNIWTIEKWEFHDYVVCDDMLKVEKAYIFN